MISSRRRRALKRRDEEARLLREMMESLLHDAAREQNFDEIRTEMSRAIEDYYRRGRADLACFWQCIRCSRVYDFDLDRPVIANDGVCHCRRCVEDA